MIAVYETLRWVNMVLAALLSVAILARAGGFLRAQLPSRMGRLTIFGWVSSVAYGSWEAMSLAARPGMRIPTTTSVLILTACWVWTEWRTDRRERRAHARLLARLTVPVPRRGDVSGPAKGYPGTASFRDGGDPRAQWAVELRTTSG